MIRITLIHPQHLDKQSFSDGWEEFNFYQLRAEFLQSFMSYWKRSCIQTYKLIPATKAIKITSAWLPAANLQAVVCALLVLYAQIMIDLLGHFRWILILLFHGCGSLSCSESAQHLPGSASLLGHDSFWASSNWEKLHGSSFIQKEIRFFPSDRQAWERPSQSS